MSPLFIYGIINKKLLIFKLCPRIRLDNFAAKMAIVLLKWRVHFYFHWILEETRVVVSLWIERQRRRFKKRLIRSSNNLERLISALILLAVYHFMGLLQIEVDERFLVRLHLRLLLPNGHIIVIMLILNHIFAIKSVTKLRYVCWWRTVRIPCTWHLIEVRIHVALIVE
jgi:hypothetical protein